jgi:hypothetical protein
MSKKVWEILLDQNQETINELVTVDSEMQSISRRYNPTIWNVLNGRRAALLDDLNTEVVAAYASQPVKSVARQGKDRFWAEVNKRVMEG